jgi:hypothetical protein
LKFEGAKKISYIGYKNFVIVMIDYVFPEIISAILNESLKSRNFLNLDINIQNEVHSFLERANRNILVFDTDGNLIWKIQEPFTKDHGDYLLKEFGHKILDQFVNLSILNIENEILVTSNATGFLVKAVIPTGEILYADWYAK